MEARGSNTHFLQQPESCTCGSAHIHLPYWNDTCNY